MHARTHMHTHTYTHTHTHKNSLTYARTQTQAFKKQSHLADPLQAELVRKTMEDILAKGGDTHKDGEVHGKAFIAYAKLLPGIDKLLTINLADELNLKVG
jgi:hypothetical protein